MHDMPLKNRERMALLGQLARYGVTGLIASFVNIGVYHAGLALGHLDPNVAWTIGFFCAATTGYIIHGNWSFRGHGSRDRQHVRVARFMVVSLISFGLNSLWVWLFVKHYGMPVWVPDLPSLCVTPVLVFWLNRQWVFE